MYMHFAGFLMPKNVISGVLQACIKSRGYIHVIESPQDVDMDSPVWNMWHK